MIERVFPPRNLPGDAEDWGREVERRIQRGEDALYGTGGTADNNSRFVAGQLSVQSNQIDEQIARTTLLSYPADLSVTGNATIEPFPRATRTISVFPPPGSRAARVEVYGTHVPSGGSVSMFAYLSYGGKIVSKLKWWQDTDAVDTLLLSPPLRGHGIGFVTLPDSGAATFTLTLVRVGFTSATTTETLTNIELAVTPFQRVT